MAINTFSKFFFCILFVNMLLMTSEAIRSGTTAGPDQISICMFRLKCDKQRCNNDCVRKNFQRGVCDDTEIAQCCCIKGF
ncbi:uncharacterized protein DS421_12g379230 [Arachis hypogaea]|nr:uncharacterized protein DS421_12g379230 [Arachis hypogaea]